MALAFNIYANNTRGIRIRAKWRDARQPYPSLLPNVGIGGNTNVIQVNVNYDGTVMAMTFKDTVTGLTVSTNWTVNIPSIVGGSTAWVGFTGADGGTVSTQDIFWGNAAAIPIEINAQKVGDSIVFSWPAASAGYLMSSPTAGSDGCMVHVHGPVAVGRQPKHGHGAGYGYPAPVRASCASNSSRKRAEAVLN